MFAAPVYFASKAFLALPLSAHTCARFSEHHSSRSFNSATLPGLKWNPVSPGDTIDSGGPILEATTGVPTLNASIIVRPIVSYHSEGKTRNSAFLIKSNTLENGLPPRYSTAG